MVHESSKGLIIDKYVEMRKAASKYKMDRGFPKVFSCGDLVLGYQPFADKIK